MNQLKEKLNIPELRFPEFNKSWGHVTIGEKFSVNIKKNRDQTEKNVLTNSATQGIVNQRDYFDKDIAVEGNTENYYIVEENDFIYNPRISVSAPVGPMKRNKLGKGIMSPLYNVFRPNTENVDFLEKYFNTAHWYQYMKQVANYGARHDRMAISKRDLMSIPLPNPVPDEQQKIVSFLSTVDEKIFLLEQQKESWEQYKKGIMQQIFSQKIRFKKDDGSEFPDWEEIKVKDILDSISTRSHQVLNTQISNTGDYPVVDQGKDMVAGYSNELDKLFTGGDAIIFGDHTAVLKYIDFSFIVGADGTKILQCKNQNLKYLYYNLVFNNISQGGYRRHFSLLKEVILQIPSLKEQQKITEFLSELDSKIQKINSKITQSKEWKKGLLQKMFV
jgi:type I restriction enzyme S subunit